MRTPGFTAEAALYRVSHYYYMAQAGAQADGVIRLALDQVHVSDFTELVQQCQQSQIPQPCGYEREQICSWIPGNCWERYVYKCPPPKTVERDCRWTRKALPSGDDIEMRVENGPSPGVIDFAIELSWNVTWWKEIRIGSFAVSVEGETPHCPGCGGKRSAVLPWYTNDLAGNWLTFSKAGFLGVHEEVFRIDLSEFANYDGKRIVFYWRWD